MRSWLQLYTRTDSEEFLQSALIFAKKWFKLLSTKKKKSAHYKIPTFMVCSELILKYLDARFWSSTVLNGYGGYFNFS